MDKDKATRARVAGRMDVQARTVWKVTVGTYRVRCVRDANKTPPGPLPLPEYMFEVHGHDEGKWKPLMVGPDPVALFDSIVLRLRGHILETAPQEETKQP